MEDFNIDDPNKEDKKKILGIVHFVFKGLVKELEEEMQELGDDTDVDGKTYT